MRVFFVAAGFLGLFAVAPGVSSAEVPAPAEVGTSTAAIALPEAPSDLPSHSQTVSSTRAEVQARASAGLEREIEALQALLGGVLGRDTMVSSLFEVDLLDQSAVERRIALIERELSRTSTTGLTELTQARRERDRLRLRVLQRPIEQRIKLLDGYRQQGRIIEAREAANLALVEAQDREAQAEAARLEALETARKARSAAERALANERARFESARSGLASLEAALATQRQAAGRSLERELETMQLLEAEARASDRPAVVADELYDRVVAQLERRRTDLSRALSSLSHRTGVEPFHARTDLGASTLEPVTEAWVLLTQEVEEHRDAEDAFRRLEEAFLVSHANEIGAQVNRLNRLRLELRRELSPRRSTRLASLTREGVGELQSELSHLLLLTRWYLRARLATLLSPKSLSTDLFALGSASWTFFKALFVLAFAFYAQGRHKHWIRRLRRRMVAHAKTRDSAFWLDRWFSSLEAISKEVFLLSVVFVGFYVILEPHALPELELAGDLLLAFAVFRLTLAVFHRSVTQAAEARSIPVSSELSQRIYRSMRLVLSYGFSVYVYLTLSEAVLGRGSLYGIAASFAWLGLLPIGTLLVAHWRVLIVESYLKSYPEGALATLVRRTQTKRRGFFAALLAFGFVAAHGLFVYGRETVLGFENTRRVLAYVFRRRLERQAEQGERKRADLELLPKGLIAACSEEELPAEAYLENFSGLNAALDDLRLWQSGGPGRTLALVGEPGIGKTCWMKSFVQHMEGPGEILRFRQRHIGEEAGLRALSEAVGLSLTLQRNELVSALGELPPRVFVLDRCHALFLRAIGGLSGYEACLDVASRTSHRHFWVLAHAAPAWSFLRRVCRGANDFDQVVTLGPWSEEDISALIERRMRWAGVSPVYDDLVIDRLEGVALSREAVRSGERFQRLLWDYVDGNPRIALHFWLRSLAADGVSRARVHLFEGPTADDLEHLQERTRFILAALVLHQDLTAEEAARALAFSPEHCEAAMRFLAKDQIVNERKGRFFVTTHWYRAVGRYLRRKGLIIA